MTINLNNEEPIELSPPFMTTAQRDAISNPIAGIMITNRDTMKEEYFDGTTWNTVPSTAEEKLERIKAYVDNELKEVEALMETASMSHNYDGQLSILNEIKRLF